MSLSYRTYTVPGHLPRLSRQSAFDNIDICYNVWYLDPSTHSTADKSKDGPRLSLIFNHGSQMCKESWNYFIELLFNHYGHKIGYIIAPDAIHSGDSAQLNAGKIGWDQAWQDLARDSIKVIYDVRKRYGDLGALFACGHSMGGAEALFMANLEPALFEGIIVMDPVWGVDNTLALDAGKQYVGWLTGRILKNAQDEFDSMEDYMAFMNKYFMSKDFHSRVKQDMETHSYFVDDQSNKVRFKASRLMRAGAYIGALSLINHSLTTFKEIRVPALVMHGDIDDWNAEGSNEKLAELLPLGQNTIIKGGGHIVFYQKPEETVAAMIPFIDKVLEQVDTSVPDVKDIEKELRAYITKLEKL